jgi:hypothetical protein
MQNDERPPQPTMECGGLVDRRTNDPLEIGS